MSDGMKGGGIKGRGGAAEGSSIISDRARMPRPVDPGSSEPPQNTAVGSGSRPTRSMYPIPTGLDGIDPHTLGRDVPGSLK
jgi:hypothetical protein